MSKNSIPPLPWKDIGPYLYDANGTLLCSFYETGRARSKATARLIRISVNSCPQLVGALAIVAKGIKTGKIPDASLIDPAARKRPSMEITPLSKVIATALAAAKESEGT
jgi:hypothetical protein